MSIVAKLFVRAVIAAGLIVLAVHLAHFRSDDLAKFICYLLLAAISSSVRIEAGGISGAVSISFVPTLLAMMDLSRQESVVIAFVAALTHYLASEWKRSLTSEALFRGSIASIAVYYSCMLGQAVGKMVPGSSVTLHLAVMAVAFVLLSVLPVALAVGQRQHLTLSRVLRRYFQSLPVLGACAALAGIVHVVSLSLGWQISLLLLPIFYLFYRSYVLFLGRVESEKKLLEETASLNLRTIEALALAVEAKDQTTGDHLQRVQVYAMGVGKELGLDENELKALQAASLLHDIGKLAVPEHIISKPGKLTPEEFEKMKVHPVVGAEILERVRFPYPVVPIVRSHHEKWDGSGYPAGLSGEEIPIGARILSAVDCLDALASDRQYRKALPLDKAMEVVARDSGKGFDPQVVEVLQRRYVELEKQAKSIPMDEFKLSTDVRINNGLAPAAGFEEARTIQINRPEGQIAMSPGELMAMVRQEIHSVLGSQNRGRWGSLLEALAALSVRLQKAVPHDTFVLYVQQRDMLVPQFTFGENQAFFRGLEIPMGSGLSGWAAENKKSILNGSPATESAHLRDPKRVSTLKGALVVPLEGTLHTLGTLSLYHHDREGFTKDQLRAIQAVSSQLAIAIEAWLRMESTPNAANTALAMVARGEALFNKLEVELEHYQKDATPFAVMLCQLDGYNEMAQLLLPSECEAVLNCVAQSLRDGCRDSDLVAHMGGQEFALVVPSLRADAVDSRMKQWREAVTKSIRELGLRHRLELLMSSVHVPADGVDAEHLLSQLDRKLQRLKAMPRSSTATEAAAAEKMPDALRMQWRTTVV